ncbi:polysaccharide deacetylase family protein [Flavobacterium terrae]|uniref:Polysaccharide deacetylase n=1 Tax=Flavobacterium terrae TaxID=415425 RepID=A0A1M6BHZ7_9FLAO|nr:polysaccharide deacetylase family protein [Flavobacterium terrae]SHI48208.1 Polysaccharide deacetylase [Flavobacterium terrae]
MILLKIKYRLLLFLKLFIFQIGLGKYLLRNRYRERIIVFHGIDKTGETKYNSRFVSEKYFTQFIDFISKNYNIISLQDFYDKKFKPNTLNIAITFDDGYANNFKYAIPILEKYSIPATFFITTIQDNNTNFLWPDFLDLVSFYSNQNSIIFENQHYSKNHKGEFIYNGISLKNRCKKLSWKEIQPLLNIFKDEWKIIQQQPLNDYWELMNYNQIKEVAKKPLFKIGSHGYTHANLNSITFEEATLEVLKGKKVLESICEKPILDFAFPFGSYNSELINYSEKIGFKRILLVDYNTENEKNNPLLRNRFVINPHINFKMQLVYLLKGKYL